MNSKATSNDEQFKKASELSDTFAGLEGRRPRIMLSRMGQEGHDFEVKVMATSFADLGFDVDIGPLFQTPKEAAKQAVENDVHVLGITSLATGHKALVSQVLEELKKYSREDIMVIVSTVISTKDYQLLFDSGVVVVFGPSAKISKVAIDILELLIES